jgi:ATP-dependent Clp protease ATP-binding subunit ClpA
MERGMYASFTENAKDVMKAANQEAMRVSHEYIGTDDILIGLALGEASLAAQVIASHSNVETIRQKLAEMPRIEGPTTSRAKKVVEQAMSEARRLSHLHVCSEHLLLGLLQDDSSDASRALSELGINLGQLKSEILNQLPPGSSEEFQEQQAIQQRFADHPDVKAMKHEIERLQRELENAVAAGRFAPAASFRDERLRVEQSLRELFSKLSKG